MTEQKWQRFRWKNRGRWSKVHLRELSLRQYGYSLCGWYPIARLVEVQEAEGTVTCGTCIRIAQARNLEGWND